MRAHAESAGVQEEACVALRTLTSTDDENKTRAGAAGAAEAVASAMRAHAESAGVQEKACLALYFLVTSNQENKTRAGKAGAKTAAEAALKAHPENNAVITEARDLLERLG
jgi:hypothetical protein